jgi:hypothetical protein
MFLDDEETVSLTTSNFDYPPALPKDLALFPDKRDDILYYYKIDAKSYERLLNNQSFRRGLASWQRRIIEENYGITAKAEVLVQQGLLDLETEMSSPETSASTKLEIQKYFANLAGLLNKKETSSQTSNAPQVNIQINL